MADPLTIGLGIGALVGGGSALLGNKGSSSAAPAAPTAPPPDPSTPATVPGSKPGQKNSQQQSFLSGAASLQRSGGGGLTGASGGKSLLGQ